MSETPKTSENDLQKMIDQVTAIKDGPRVLQLYMELCVKCGTCADQCHVAQSMLETRTNPAARSDLSDTPYMTEWIPGSPGIFHHSRFHSKKPA